MEYKDLVIFCHVARIGSMTRAAEDLGYVQSHITARIRKLENELGRPLFERTKRGVVLTNEGTQWLPHVESLLSQWEHTVHALQAPDTPGGLLRLGSLETTAAIHAAGWLSVYHCQFPQVDLSLETGTTDELVQRVLDRDLDAAFVADEVDHPRVARRIVAVEDLQIITARGTEWTSWVHAASEVVMVTFREGCAYRRRLEAWFKEQHVRPTRLMECASVEAILQLVAGGLGVTCLPLAVVKPLSTRIPVQWQPIDDVHGKIPTSVIWNKSRLPSTALTALLGLFDRLPVTAELPFLNNLL